jgi:hypothetical protein
MIETLEQILKKGLWPKIVVIQIQKF